jgi:uncharacterized protein with PIN domain
VADAMLERLARWLRVLGYDVLSAGPAGAHAAPAQGAAVNRIILTRNRAIAIPGVPGGSLLIEHHSPLDQLVEVLAKFRLQPPWQLFMRCLICNTPLLPDDSHDVQPPGAEGNRETRRCPSCGRLYWEGLHTRRMRDALRRALGSTVAEPET